MPENVLQEPKIAEVEDSSDSDDEAPALESGPNGEPTVDANGKKQNRGEKKNRKQIAKLGMKLVTGINRVSVKKGKSMLFVINNPEVYVGPGNQYVVFGEAKMEDPTANFGAQALQQAAQSAAMKEFEAKAAAGGEGAATGETKKVEEAATEGATGEPSDKDVDLVMSQAGCNKEEAIKALKANKNDIVEAIMHFTSQ